MKGFRSLFALLVFPALGRPYPTCLSKLRMEVVVLPMLSVVRLVPAFGKQWLWLLLLRRFWLFVFEVPRCRSIVYVEHLRVKVRVKGKGKGQA